MKNGQKSIRIKLIHSVTIQGINPNASELGLVQNEFLIRIYSNKREIGMIYIENSIWINQSSLNKNIKNVIFGCN